MTDKPYRCEKHASKPAPIKSDDDLICCDQPMRPISGGLSMESMESATDIGTTYECAVCGLRKIRG